MSRHFMAMFHSDCEACGLEINAGDLAIYNSDHEVIHLGCSDEPDPAEPGGITL